MKQILQNTTSVEMKAPLWEDELKKEIMDKLDVSEETLLGISQLGEGNLGVSQAIDIKLPVVNGYGAIVIGSFTNPFPWSITAKIDAKIVAPSNGSWRIRVKANDSVKFDQSGITLNQDMKASVSVGGWSTVKVSGEAWWSEKANTTLELKGTASI